MSENNTLRTARTLPYPPDRIFNAFSSPDLLTLWWGPTGFSNTFDVFEFRNGGQWKFVMHGLDGKAYRNDSVFLEIIDNEKIVIRHDCHPYFTLTITLTPTDNGAHLTWEQTFDDAKTAQAISQRVGSANDQNIDRLDALLKEEADPVMQSRPK